MKKKILALVCAMTMVLGATMTVFAAESTTAKDTVTESGVTVKVPTEAEAAAFAEDTSVKVEVGDELKDVSVTPVSPAIAEEASTEAAKNVAAAADVDTAVQPEICTVVDVNNNGEGGKFTLAVPAIKNATGKGFIVLHKNGEVWETVPSTVDPAAGTIAFTLSSTSPVAVVSYTLKAAPETPSNPPADSSSGSGSTDSAASTEQPASPKTGDPLFAVEAMAAVSAVVAGLAAKKRK